MYIINIRFPLAFFNEILLPRYYSLINLSLLIIPDYTSNLSCVRFTRAQCVFIVERPVTSSAFEREGTLASAKRKSSPRRRKRSIIARFAPHNVSVSVPIGIRNRAESSTHVHTTCNTAALPSISNARIRHCLYGRTLSCSLIACSARRGEFFGFGVQCAPGSATEKNNVSMERKTPREEYRSRFNRRI